MENICVLTNNVSKLINFKQTQKEHLSSYIGTKGILLAFTNLQWTCLYSHAYTSVSIYIYKSFVL